MSVNKVNSDGSLSRVAGGTLYADAPIGTISPFGGSTVPSGYLLCNGAEVLKTTYAELYAVIGDAFGTASDNTKFVLPDLREATTKGAGLTGHTVGNHLDADGLAVGEFLDDRVQEHTHIYTGVHSSSTAYIPVSGGSGGMDTDDLRTGITEKNTGRSGDTTEVKSVGVNYIIKAKQVAVPFDMAEYIRNQNVLSEYENITLPVSSVPYDGLLTVSVSNGGYVSFSIDSRNFTIGSATGTSDTSEITLKKGTNIGFLEAGGTYALYAKYYKLRDYTGR